MEYVPQSVDSMTEDQKEAARRAGWNLNDGPPPYVHTLPPDDAEEEDEKVVRRLSPPRHLTGGLWPNVRAEHQRNVGFVEGKGNKNPWTEELFGPGVDASYCIAAATVIPHHQGLTWPADVTFPGKGFAYCPYALTWAVKHGLFEYDHTSKGAPATAHEGDLYLWSWGMNGHPDHCETAFADDNGAGGSFHNILGYNTGSPEGCHSGITRPGKYLVGVIHMCRWAYPLGSAPQPVPVPQPAPPVVHPSGNPYIPLTVDGQFGPKTVKALQWRLKNQGFRDLNGHDVAIDGGWGKLTASALQRYLHVGVDGNFGPVSTKALQRHVGTSPDGQWGPATNRAIQNHLNAQTF